MKTSHFSFTLVSIISLIFSGCGNRQGDQTSTSARPSDEMEMSSPTGTAKIAAAAPDLPKSGTITSLEYAIWVNHKENDRTYDGLYDRTSRKISLCENGSEYHIDDTSEIVLSPNNGCYRKQLYAYHMTFNADSQLTIFLNMIAFDSAHSQLIGVSSSGDTLIAPYSHIEAAALQKMKFDPESNNSSEEKTQIIRNYSKPEMQKINSEKMKMNVYRKHM